MAVHGKIKLLLANTSYFHGVFSFGKVKVKQEIQPGRNQI
jgi:hypothetical protein